MGCTRAAGAPGPRGGHGQHGALGAVPSQSQHPRAVSLQVAPPVALPRQLSAGNQWRMSQQGDLDVRRGATMTPPPPGSRAGRGCTAGVRARHRGTRLSRGRSGGSTAPPPTLTGAHTDPSARSLPGSVCQPA